MPRLRLLAFALCAFAAAAPADEPKTGDKPETKDKDKDKKDKKLDPAKLPGSYKIVDGWNDGEKLSEKSKKAPVTFTKDKVSTKAESGSFVFKYKVNPDKTPATIDMETVEPEGLKGSKAVGILKMEGGKLHLAYNAKGGATPKEFKSEKESNVLYFVLEAVKKGKGKDKKDEKKPEDKKDGGE